MNKKLKKYKTEVAGGAIGAVAGWCYWYFVGCASGTCPISSSPFISTAYGIIMGGLLFSILSKDKTGKNA